MVSLADAILQEDITSVQHMLRFQDVNKLDEYGFTPLIEAAIVNNIEIARLLLQSGANPNVYDATGGTALHWAAENNNLAFCELLFEYLADPNAFNFAGQPVLVMPILRQQYKLKNLLLRHGANLVFAQDFINTKLLGHMFELIGTANIVAPNKKFAEVDFEGFFLEITLGLIADALAQFKNHFGARQLRKYAGLSQYIVGILQRAARLIQFQQYRVDISMHEDEINELIVEEPLIIPVGYEGHAITFIKYQDLWVKCDRREDSRLYDNVMFYKVTNPEQLTPDFLKGLIYNKQSSRYINEDLDNILGLEPFTELKVEAQISGNCSWANVEATIPALFLLVLMQMNNDSKSISYYKTLALNYFTRWREWNKDRALHYCIASFKEGNALRKASKAEILAAILFQRCESTNVNDQARIELILSTLVNSSYEYIIKNYLRVYLYQNYTEEGYRFSEMLKNLGYKL